MCINYNVYVNLWKEENRCWIWGKICETRREKLHQHHSVQTQWCDGGERNEFITLHYMKNVSRAIQYITLPQYRGQLIQG